MNDIRLENDNTVSLCAKKLCCPKLTKLPDGRYMLTDDEGNHVVLTREQAMLVNSGMSVLDGTQEQLICG